MHPWSARRLWTGQMAATYRVCVGRRRLVSETSEDLSGYRPVAYELHFDNLVIMIP